MRDLFLNLSAMFSGIILVLAVYWFWGSFQYSPAALPLALLFVLGGFLVARGMRRASDPEFGSSK